MDERVKKLKTTESCEKFAKNATRLGHIDLAEQALKRSIQIRANEHGAQNKAEQECLHAIYAYEEVLTKKNGKRTRASRTWQMIKRHGILVAAERAVNREQETMGYKYLAEMGLQEYAFEAVILRYPDFFSDQAVKVSKKRMSEWNTENE